MKARWLTVLGCLVSLVLLSALALAQTTPTAAQSRTSTPEYAAENSPLSITVTKAVTPTGRVQYGDELTYTVVISTAIGTQLRLYDPLTDTTLVRFVELPATGVITYAENAVTGTLSVTPTNRVTVCFTVQAGTTKTTKLPGAITNQACVYPAAGTLGGCIWSNQVTNSTFRLYTVFLPLVLRHYPPVYTISGQVTDVDLNPIASVNVATEAEHTATTAADGHYTLTGLTAGTYRITPSKQGYTFLPTSRTVSVPPDAVSQDFIALPSPTPTPPCTEEIANGGFEEDNAWEIPLTEYPATYTTALAHSGQRSMRVGIVAASHNRESYSSARQAVTIPTDAVSATLRFWLYPLSGEQGDPAFPAQPLAATVQEAALDGDVQYVVVLNESNEWIGTLVWQLSDQRKWKQHQFDLLAYAGRTIKLQFGAYNDGWDGVTATYVDDVSLEICRP